MTVCQKRINKEYTDLIENPLPNIKICHDINDILNWYCLIYDLTDEEYLGGQYIFNIKLSLKYPFEPPDFFFLTPNGRFDINKKLCFSNSSYHKESWSPMWTIKTIILGFLSFFLEKSSSGIGHIKTTSELKTVLASESIKYNKDNLTKILDLFN
jgi:ubiquitin-conjugating enzyme E2 J2